MSTKYSGRRMSKTQINKRNARNKRGKKKSFSPLFAFVITLGAVLLIGAIALICIVLPKHVNEVTTEQVIAYNVPVEAIPEAIPEPTVKEEVEVKEPKTKYGDIIKDEKYLKENNIFLKDGGNDEVVTLGFIGDILFDDEYSVMSSLKLRGGELTASMSQATLDRMNAVDVMVVNNEFPYTERGSKLPNKQFNFHADYDTAFYLNDMGADVAIIANNHVYDYGEEGLLDTIDTLNNVGVHPVGAGRNLEEAVQPVYYIVNDIKVAIVAASQIERLDNPDTKGATKDSAGVFRCWNNDLIYTAIEVAKQNADFVVACIHWGTEKDPVPDCWQTKMAPKLAEAGADLIIGDHTHRLQGVYYYGDTPCIYSMGNFWFNGTTTDTGMVEVTVGKDGLKSFQFLPAIQSNYSTNLVYDGEKQRILDYMKSLSKGVNIDDDGFITKK